MIWADRIAKELAGKPQHVDDMFTPSGYAHVGSLRGPILHDVMYRVLKEHDRKTEFTYVFNDFDPIDGLPPDLKDKFSTYLGYPLRLAPSPDRKHQSFADYFASDFKSVLESLGVSAGYLSSWDMYHEGTFNDVIHEALDNAQKILGVYKKVAGYKKKPADWYPLQVICPNCKKLGTTKVTGWDGKLVNFCCEKEMVTWAQGCGICGKISPFDGNAKLPWKVDWPAHWKVLGVTFEGAGKDHASRGGSYDIAFALSDEVFHYPKPYYFPYEFFLFGGKKMSSSKGIGLKGRDLTSILPAEVARFLIVRVIPQKTLEFDPAGNTIPDLFDEFDRCAKAFWDKTDEDLARIFELSQVNSLYEQKVFLPRFRDVANWIQLPSVDIYKRCEEEKGTKLTPKDKKVLNQRVQYARIWLTKFASSEATITVSEEFPSVAQTLSDKQKNYLNDIIRFLDKEKNPENLQQILFEQTKVHNISAKEGFQAIYKALLGKDAGPKAGPFLLSLDKAFLKKRFEEAASSIRVKEDHQEGKYRFEDMHEPNILAIDKAVQKKYPSVVVGVAIIKGVTIHKNNTDLQNEIHAVLSELKALTTEEIGEYPEIQSYRKLYKEMGIDWHSRRPSPEALLRRIATGKGLYSVNTCVDAYNVVVLRNRISVGAFDLDKITFPTILRYAKEGEEILLLGDTEPTQYTSKELAYFDQVGGYNIDFNFRDAQRTMVTESTKNLWINTEGVFDIERNDVEKALQETIDIITKYCGGTVELSGIVKTSKI